MDVNRDTFPWSESTVVPESGCWEWQKCRSPHGYGRIGSIVINGASHRGTYTHRVSWALANGEWPEGLVVRHKCDNPPCINPEHLEIGTHADNARDRQERGRGVGWSYVRVKKPAVVRISREDQHRLDMLYVSLHTARGARISRDDLEDGNLHGWVTRSRPPVRVERDRDTCREPNCWWHCDS